MNILNHLLINTNKVINNIELDLIKININQKINTIDKSTSTEFLYNSINDNNGSNNINNINNYDLILVENEIDLIDDVYDYFPCHNFKKQTVYDILLNNLTK